MVTRKFFSYIFCAILCLSLLGLPIMSTPQPPSWTGKTGTQYLKLVSSPYTIENIRGYDRVKMEGFYTRGLPGAPELPQKTYDVELSIDAQLETVKMEILSATSEILPGEYEIAPAPLPATGSLSSSDGGTTVQGKNTAIYGKDEFYPSTPVEISRVYQERNRKVVRIQFTPLQYNPVTKKLQLTREVRIGISWNKGLSMALGAPPPGWTGYAIITTNAILSGSSSLGSFVTYLQARGFTVTIITETQYGPPTGQQRAINIRSWLASNYVSLQLQYALLIGDPDPDDPANAGDSFGDVPMMMCWPNPGSAADQTPTDYFYSDLTGNWDSDGDGFYGEFGQDAVDFGPEVYVGRVPVYGSDYATLDSILNKFINYNGANQSIMLPMAISNYQDEHNQGNSCSDGDIRTDGLDLPQYVIVNIAGPNGWSDYVMYERSGFTGRGHDPVPVTAYGYDGPLTNANVVGQWSNDYGIVFWWGHGNQTGAYRKYWGDAADDGDNVVEDWFCGASGDELSTPAFFTSGDTGAVIDADTFAYLCSCLNGYPENPNNLGYALLKRGAICTVSASRISWYAVATWSNWGIIDNAGIGYEYADHLVNSGESAGKALYDGKNALGNPWGWVGWMNLFDFNLYGDPSLTLAAPVIPSALVSSISAAPPTVSSGQQITVTMNVQNTGGTQANGVTPSALTVNTAGTASAALVSGPIPASANIPAAGSQNYIWVYTANSGASNGTLSFTGNASGIDSGTGTPVSSPVTTSNTVTVQGVCTAPSLLSPANNSTVSSQPVAFSWIGTAASYTLQVSDSGYFNTANTFTYPGIVATAFVLPQNLPSGTWYWRVRSEGACSGQYSAIWRFTIQGGSGANLTLSYAKQGSVIILTAYLTNSAGRPLSGCNIAFYQDNIYLTSVTTNRYGYATLRITPARGPHSAYAVYRGSPYNTGATSNTVFYIV